MTIATAKKNILFFSLVIPEPKGVGIRMRVYKHIKALSENNNLHLVTTVSSEDVPKETRDLCEDITFHHSSRFDLDSDRWMDYENIEDQVYVAFRLKAAEQLDVVLENLNIRPSMMIVDFDDVESIRSRRSLVHYISESFLPGIRKNIFNSIRLLREYFWFFHLYLRQRRAEKHMLRKWTKIIVCSETDRHILSKRVPEGNVNVVPNTIHLVPVPHKRENNEVINCLFVGTLNYEPNVDAVHFFCTEIWPEILERLDNQCSLTIAGRYPDSLVCEYADKAGAELVDSPPELDKYYQASDIVIVPIRFGGGTRIKILEAMSYSRPIVTTTIGVEGIEAVNSRHLKIADTPSRFAETVVQLATDEKERYRLGANGRKLVEKRYSEGILSGIWDGILRRR